MMAIENGLAIFDDEIALARIPIAVTIGSGPNSLEIPVKRIKDRIVSISQIEFEDVIAGTAIDQVVAAPAGYNIVASTA